MTVATPEQVEAVARAIDPYAWEKESNDWEMTLAIESVRNQSLVKATAAIAAYEATRPAVPSDEELARVYDDAQYQAHVAHESGNVTGHLAGIRAVRERLEP